MSKISETNLIEIIRKGGFKATPTRIEVLTYLQKNKYPVDLKQIVKGVGAEKINQVTVYRMMDAFKKAGIVSQVDLQQGRPYFEFKDDRHDHHHIVCTNCKKIEDFVGCEYRKIADKALKQVSSFQTVTNHAIELFGLCKDCFKKEKSINFA